MGAGRGEGPDLGGADPGPEGGAARAALAARDARQALVDAHRPPAGSSLVAVSLNVPGPGREPPGALALQAWALARLLTTLRSPQPLASQGDALGPFALLQAGGEPGDVKRACVALEEASPAARLLDLDVYGPDGAQVGRGALGLPPRPCLLCAAPAAECIRLGRHPRQAVVARVHALLAALDP